MQKTDNWVFTLLLQSMHLQDFFFLLHTYMSFFIVSSSSPNSALLSLIELTAVRQDCLSLYSSMSRGFNWCHRALNLSSSCWKACTLDSTLLFITSTFKDCSNNYYIVLERIFTSRNDIMSCTASHSFIDQNNFLRKENVHHTGSFIISYFSN